MAQDPESRPISVSELLARRRAEDSSIPETGEFSAVGRRRSGRDGSMSVAELTGEIPKITGPEPGSVPTVEPDSTPGPESTTGPESTSPPAPKSPSPLIARSDSAFPRSASPAPTARSGAARTASGMPGIGGFSAAGTPAADQAPVVASPSIVPSASEPSAEAITGIIPLVDDGVDDDLDFESYRNFADYDTDAAASAGKKDKPKKEKQPKQRRGLFGRNKGDRSRAAAVKSAAEPSIAEPVFPAPTGPAFDSAPLITPTVDPRVGADAAVTPSVTPTEPAPAIVPSVRRSASTDDDDGPAITPHVVARTVPPVESGVEDTQEISVVRSVSPSVTPAVTPSVTPAVRRSATVDPHVDTDPVDADVPDVVDAAEIPDEAPLASKHSPLMQWVLLIGQVIVGLAIGAGLFWGFLALWQWNVIFALVLAAVVIFGIVTLVHVVRRRHDLLSTLLALGVGLIVTIGPLVFLASSDS